MISTSVIVSALALSTFTLGAPAHGHSGHTGADLAIDILKAGFHGAKTSMKHYTQQKYEQQQQQQQQQLPQRSLDSRGNWIHEISNHRVPTGDSKNKEMKEALMHYEDEHEDEHDTTSSSPSHRYHPRSSGYIKRGQALGHVAAKQLPGFVEDAIPAFFAHEEGKKWGHQRQGQGQGQPATREYEEREWLEDLEEREWLEDLEERDFEDGEFEERDFEDGDMEERDFDDDDFEAREFEDDSALEAREVNPWAKVFYDTGLAMQQAFGGASSSSSSPPPPTITTQPHESRDDAPLLPRTAADAAEATHNPEPSHHPAAPPKSQPTGPAKLVSHRRAVHDEEVFGRDYWEVDELD